MTVLVGTGDPPVAVGGVGGSGTRVVAEVLERSGRYLGSDLNAARDNLWFTLLFKHDRAMTMSGAEFDRLFSAFVGRMTGTAVDPGLSKELEVLATRASDQHSDEWLAERLRTFLRSESDTARRPWGWKEPNTHVVLHQLSRVPDLRYVHVARNGLDMAVSSNQNQPRMWGDAFGVVYDGSPASSLHFWCRAQERALALGADLGKRFLFLRFEDLCSEPEQSLLRLLLFTGHPDAAGAAARLAPIVRSPSSIGRAHDLGMFSSSDVDFVESLGFRIPV